VATPAHKADRFQRAGGALLRPESVRALLEVGLEDWLHDDLRRGLYHAIAHRGDPQRPLGAVRLRNVLAPYRLRPVRARLKASLNVEEKRTHAFLLDRRQCLPVDAGSPLVRTHPLPCFRQDVTPADPVVERMKASLPIPLGRHEQPALELSDFVHRVVGPLGHALALTPSRRRDQSRALSLQRRYPPSSLLRAPRTPSRHGRISPSAYTRRLRPTWAIEEGLPSSASGCPCVLSSIPRKRPASLRCSEAVSCLRHDMTGSAASPFGFISHGAAKFTLSYSARRFAPLARDPTASAGPLTLRIGAVISATPGACYAALRRLPRRDSHPLVWCSTESRPSGSGSVQDAPWRGL